MQQGTVIWFNGSKGFGFLKPAAGGPDIFVHYSAIASQEKYKTLNEGDVVTYEEQPGKNGKKQAGNVQVIEAAQAATT